VPSEYAKAAKAAGLDLIGWSLERDGPASTRAAASITPRVKGRDRPRRRPRLTVARRCWPSKFGVRAMFSDWPGTTNVLCELHGG